MIETIKNLINNPELLALNSKNAKKLAKKFDWKNIVKHWEEEIIKLYHN